MYRFIVGLGENAAPVDASNSPAGGNALAPSPAIERYEKLTGAGGQLVSLASRDPRARVLLGFARFPTAQLESNDCIGRTLVQFADLRYTEPGTARGNFSLSVSAECPAP
jgi:hypothetical protein